MRQRIFFLLLTGCLLGGCMHKVQPVIEETVLLSVTPSASSQQNTMSAWIAPYKIHIDSAMGIRLGSATAELTFGLPNAPLNTFVAEAMLAFGEERFGEVDFAVSNLGGLRAALPAGDITVGHIYQVMPFDNEVVLLTLAGSDVAELAQAIARKGGEVTAGITMMLARTAEGVQAQDVRIQGEPLDTARVYRIVTTDYLSFGNDQLQPLGRFIEMESSHTELRTVLIDYVIDADVAHRTIVPPTKQSYYVLETLISD